MAGIFKVKNDLSIKLVMTFSSLSKNQQEGLTRFKSHKFKEDVYKKKEKQQKTKKLKSNFH